MQMHENANNEYNECIYDQWIYTDQNMMLECRFFVENEI